MISLESPLAGRFVRSAPEPWNDVAVTEHLQKCLVANSASPFISSLKVDTPTTTKPFPETLTPLLAVMIPTASILVTSLYVFCHQY